MAGVKGNDAEWWESEFWFVVQPVPLNGLLVSLWALHLRQGDAWSLILTVSLFYLLTVFFLHYWMFRFYFSARTFRLSMCLSVMTLCYLLYFFSIRGSWVCATVLSCAAEYIYIHLNRSWNDKQWWLIDSKWICNCCLLVQAAGSLMLFLSHMTVNWVYLDV